MALLKNQIPIKKRIQLHYMYCIRYVLVPLLIDVLMFKFKHEDIT